MAEIVTGQTQVDIIILSAVHLGVAVSGPWYHSCRFTGHGLQEHMELGHWCCYQLHLCFCGWSKSLSFEIKQISGRVILKVCK